MFVNYFEYYNVFYSSSTDRLAKCRDLFPLPKKVIGKVSRFIHTTHSIRKLLPLGHRWRGDVDVIEIGDRA